MRRGLLAVGGGEFAELGDGGGNDFEGGMNFGLGSVAAEAEADAGAGFSGRKTDGCEHMRWLDGSRRTSRACGAREALEVERNDECLALDARKREVGRIRRAGSRARVRVGIGNAREEPAFELVAESGNAGRVALERKAREFGGLAEADNARNIFRSRAEAALVVSAEEKLAKTRAALDEERADSFRGMEFVPGERKEIELERLDVDWDFTDRLHGVRVEIDVGFGGNASDFRERLDGAEFVIRMHDGDKHGAGANRLAKFVEVDQAVARDGKVRYSDALFFESLTGVKDGFVFDGRGNDMLRRGGRGSHDAENGVVVRLSAATGKHNFLGTGIEEGRNLIAGGFDGRSRALTEGVDRGGIAEIGGEIGKHGIEYGGLDGGGGVVIKVDAVHGQPEFRIEVREGSVQ